MKAAKAPRYDETSPLVPAADGQYSDRQRFCILVGLCITYIFCIAPVALCAALVPSLEDDIALGWRPVSSGIYLGGATWAIALGSFSLGWISDHFPNVLILGMYVFVAGLLLQVMSVMATSFTVMVVHLICLALKGVAWPAAMSILGTHLRRTQTEFGILCVGLTSRFGHTACIVIMGELLYAMDWRSAVRYIGGCLVMVAILGRGLIGMTGMTSLTERRVGGAAHALEVTAVASPVRSSSSSSRSSLITGVVIEEWFSVFKDIGLWIVLAYGCGNEALLNLQVYAGAFAHSVYGMTPAESTLLMSGMNAGEVLSIGFGIGLVVAGVPRLTIHRIILCLVAIAVTACTMALSTDMTLWGYTVFNFTLGFCCTLGGYVVMSLFCIERAKVHGAAHIALRVTVAEGMSSLVGACCKLGVGYAREVGGEHIGVITALIAALVGSSICFCALSALIYLYADDYLSTDVVAKHSSDAAEQAQPETSSSVA